MLYYENEQKREVIVDDWLLFI